MFDIIISSFFYIILKINIQIKIIILYHKNIITEEIKNIIKSFKDLLDVRYFY